MDRPQVLHRMATPAKSSSSVSPRKCPPWVEIARITLDTGKTRDFHLCQDWPTLLWFANFGCIELIPWNCRLGSLDWPDYMVIDLDPDDVPFPQVVEAALAVRKILDRTGAESYCKTSGKRGLHIYVPLGKKYRHEQAKIVGELVARLVHRQLPATTTLKQRRGGPSGK
jgi:bifunctional non-homologous end joining protein LigD